MDCDRYEAILSEETGMALARALEAHLRGCPACSRKPPEERALLLAMASSVEAALRVEPSADFVGRVRQRVAVERARPSRLGRLWLSGVAATVALVLALVAGRMRWTSPVEEARPPVADPSARAEAIAPGRATAGPAAALPEAPRARQTVGGRARSAKPGPPFAADVIVDPGQAEALARLAGGVATPRARSVFVLASLDPERPLPRLETVEPPRFEMKPLELAPSESSAASDLEDSAGDTNEGSDS
jgi:hypothetical protein